GLPPHRRPAACADIALRLALDRAARVPRADAGRDPFDRRQRHVPGRGLEPLARRRTWASLGARHRDAADDGAPNRALLADRRAAGTCGDLAIGYGARPQRGETRMSIPSLSAHGATMPVIGLGTSGMGDVRAESIATALKLGYRHIDTAWKYGT